MPVGLQRAAQQTAEPLLVLRAVRWCIGLVALLMPTTERKDGSLMWQGAFPPTIFPCPSQGVPIDGTYADRMRKPTLHPALGYPGVRHLSLDTLYALARACAPGHVGHKVSR